MSTPRPGDVASLSFDLSALVRRSVATLYSHLVTRPTGRALRLGIESQLEELGGGPTLSILDFRQVVVLDYSCADEIVARLLRRFQGDDRPADVYFLARGVAERHREPIEEVLLRHGLALVAQLEAGDVALLGDADEVDRRTWSGVQRIRRGNVTEVAAILGLLPNAAEPSLQRLVAARSVYGTSEGTFIALTAIAPR